MRRVDAIILASPVGEVDTFILLREIEKIHALKKAELPCAGMSCVDSTETALVETQTEETLAQAQGTLQFVRR